jgi:riboflavin kinase/FMN adenylyltransferase
MDCHPRSIVSTDYVPSLLTTTEERVSLLKEAGIEEVEVLHFDKRMSEMDAPTFMRSVLKERLGVKVLVMGYDHRFGHGGGSQEDYARWGKECGIEVVVARELDDVYASSSEIRRKLSEGDVRSAALLLGHPYMLTGMVESGHQIGRTLGFPTANLRIVADKLIPANGVYAVKPNLGNGIINIGKRPTLDNGNNRSIEVHIINYDGDLYGKGIQLDFIARIREERKFANLDELRTQIHNDLEKAKLLFDATY